MRHTRTPSRISDSLHQRLNSYALAASAAGVGILALTQPSEAKIIYRPANVKIGSEGLRLFHLDLNHDRTIDFTFYWSAFSSTELVGEKLLVSPSGGGNAVEVSVHSSSTLALALNSGTTIAPSNFRSRGYNGLMVLAIRKYYSMDRGFWGGAKGRYLGLKFNIKGRSHYGWARLRVKVVDGYYITATLTGYAYETIPNKPIIAGKTHGKDVITLEPASLGHLARGASTIPAWRAKETK